MEWQVNLIRETSSGKVTYRCEVQALTFMRWHVGPVMVGADAHKAACNVLSRVVAAIHGGERVTTYHKHDEAGCLLGGMCIGQLYHGSDMIEKANWQARMINLVLDQP